MKKVILLILVSILLLCAFTSCAKIKGIFNKKEKECEHEWTEATCQAAKTCTLCGVTEGQPTAHKTTAPTCTEPEKCSVCGFVSEFWKPALDHDWVEASCLKGTPKTCRRCKLVEGDVPEHTWVDPTCTEDAYCEVCNFVNKDSALGHNIVTVPATAPTCKDIGYSAHEKCDRCGYIEEGKEPTAIPAIEHKGFEVTVAGKAPTCEEDGYSPGKKCNKCGEMTEPHTTIPAIGHARYLYNIDGDPESGIRLDGHLRTEYAPVDPSDPDGAHYWECEADFVVYFKCFNCECEVSEVMPKVDHYYGDDVTCKDSVFCYMCSKPIDHEYLNPTCTAPAICRICGEVQEGSEALGHDMADATCMGPSTCKRGCGYTEGEKLLHTITLGTKLGRPYYACKTCDTTFTFQDEYYYFDGSTHDNMVPVENAVRGYETQKSDNGEPTHFPLIKTDDNGNKYYSLIRDHEPDNDAEGNPKPPQIQLWIPNQRAGFESFNLASSAVGFLSFRMNGYMDTNMSMTLVEGGGWSDSDVIKDIFRFVVVTNEDEGTVKVQLLGYDDKNPDTPETVLFEKDITGVTDVNEKFTGWHDVYIGIVFNDAAGTITFHYYVDGIYKASSTGAVPTAGKGFKCVYISGNSTAMGSGFMFDDLSFGYTAVGEWVFDTNHTHSFTKIHEQVAPTCTSDGYIIYRCSDDNCLEIGDRISIAALGHLRVDIAAKDPTCTEDGNNAHAYCEREGCGKVFIEKIVYEANGHNYHTYSDDRPTCTTSGYLYQVCKICDYENEVSYDALGHDYLLTDDCNAQSICQRCGSMSTENIGHDYAPATCTEPATCRRENFGATTGEPLGHDMAEPNCTVPSTCKRCHVYTEGVKLPHVIEHKYEKSKLTYFCTLCDISFAIENGYFHNGSDHNSMTGVNNSANYTVMSGTQLPAIKDDHYEFINTVGTKSQMQLWIPADTGADFGFSSANSAVGFLSFKMNVKADPSSDGKGNLDIKLVDGASNQGDNRWKAGGVAGHLTIENLGDGKVTFKLGTVNVDGKQVNTHTIATPAVGADEFSGWVDIKIGISLDYYSDQVTYHCYVDGEYVLSFSAELTTQTNSINCLYLSGNTSFEGSGVMFDDFAFGYTANSEWIFDTCNHNYGAETVVAPTCTAYGYTVKTCSVCNYICTDQIVDAIGHIETEAPTCENGSYCERCKGYFGEALGHIGGTATCKEQATCERCGNKYGETKHTIVEATCDSAAYCSVCEEIFGDAVSHNPIAKFDIETSKLSYQCKYCEITYVLDNAYYQDGENALGPVVTLCEDGSFECDTDNGYYDFELKKAAAGNGKAWLWMPTNGTGITTFEDFSNAKGAVGILSFSLDVYSPFEVKLIDSDFRGSGDAFWTSYTKTALTTTAPSDNVVTFKAADGSELTKVTVTDANQYTGWIDVAIGIEMVGNGKMALHYYINGQYVKTVTTDLPLSAKIDGVSFLAQTKTVGGGFKLDNIGFGYAIPTESNPAPKKS